MNTATVTSRTSPFSTPYTGIAPYADTTPTTMLALYHPALWDTPSAFLINLTMSGSGARKVWHEAQWLDVLFDAHKLNRDYAHGIAERSLAQALISITQLRERVNQLQIEQIEDGSDPRLVSFWENAQKEASANNFCSEYDRMAESLGGPRRVSTYAVETHVTISLTVRVEATSEDDAIEAVDSYDTSSMKHLVGDLDYYGIDVVGINAQEANAESDD